MSYSSLYGIETGAFCDTPREENMLTGLPRLSLRLGTRRKCRRYAAPINRSRSPTDSRRNVYRYENYRLDAGLHEI